MNRTASSVLLALGIALVLIGLTTALGFTVTGIVASMAAVAALLYAGGLWFGEINRLPSALVFNRELRISGGAHAGKTVSSRFPPSMREPIEDHCKAAIAGRHSRFICLDGSRQRTFVVAPVVAGSASDICGVLVEGPALVDESLPADAAVGVI